MQYNELKKLFVANNYSFLQKEYIDRLLELHTLVLPMSEFKSRVYSKVCSWFSCGAPSAVAAMLAAKRYGTKLDVLYNIVIDEHPDNLRFLKDVSDWLGQDIILTINTTYSGSCYDVYNKTGWLVGPKGARCTIELKKRARFNWQHPEDIHIFGLTVDESLPPKKGEIPRAERFEKQNPELNIDWILIEKGLTKSDCKNLIREAGIELPVMYRLGYKNNNCVGCVKGQAGYWNKIRIDFPDQFVRMAEQERKMGVAINKTQNGKKRVRVFLDELGLDKGNYKSEKHLECGVLCQSAQDEINR